MKLFTILFSTFVTVNANMYNNLGFMRSVSKRFPHSKHRLTSVDVQSVGKISSGKKVPRNEPIQKSYLVKSRRLRNTLTTENAQHYDQPLLYRTNPVYAMKPDVMNRIHYLEEMRPWNLCKKSINDTIKLKLNCITDQRSFSFPSEFLKCRIITIFLI